MMIIIIVVAVVVLVAGIACAVAASRRRKRDKSEVPPQSTKSSGLVHVSVMNANNPHYDRDMVTSPLPGPYYSSVDYNATRTSRGNKYEVPASGDQPDYLVPVPTARSDQYEVPVPTATAVKDVAAPAVAPRNGVAAPSDPYYSAVHDDQVAYAAPSDSSYAKFRSPPDGNFGRGMVVLQEDEHGARYVCTETLS